MAEPKEAQQPEAGAQPAPEAWFFCLRLLGGRYAFEAPLVTEVVRLGPLTRLPAAPAFLPGVFTHRGEVLPVLDVAQLVGQGSVTLRPSTRAAIVHCGPWKVAVVSDSVEGLVAIPRRQLEPPPAESSGVAEFLSAVGRDRAGAVAILDLPRLVETARARAVPAGSGSA
ncbi:chemotaxis protein CheW [Anaeromyxobacter terrae]|uniref:chemotaxis protein CheW n=1 Tax=Anaeromyxobacter terrae TaxID=2925406 RepID=UPI001F5A171A|nr:chemotaxis protein CheW [Anaeromyxobacter sp. SG22]